MLSRKKTARGGAREGEGRGMERSRLRGNEIRISNPIFRGVFNGGAHCNRSGFDIYDSPEWLRWSWRFFFVVERVAV